MKPSLRCIELIKQFEGIRDGDPQTVNLDPYLCPADVATIGWGHAITYLGKQLRGRAGLRQAQAIYPYGITMQEAEDLLYEDVAEKALEVESLLKDVQPTQGEFDALVSFAYNIGTDIDDDEIAEGLGDSTLLKKYLRGDINGAADEFGKWVFSGGKRLRGLERRRAAERELFLS